MGLVDPARRPGLKQHILVTIPGTPDPRSDLPAIHRMGRLDSYPLTQDVFHFPGASLRAIASATFRVRARVGRALSPVSKSYAGVGQSRD